ncbi:sensor histidine kinase [Leucobacter tenebrionis]|uniref:sensor histidine kinase n=1 Tax=Leucobacter tenebrionis TaxID=2873270 RepID=UPI001CA71F80|nr:histidine kinase [Leucobacter tenebrionis]QZY52316.1 two-component sensor histidine kinase [Leucobacter tenebrionis]
MSIEQSTAAEVRLPRPPGVIRRALAAHPLAVDVFIVVWYFIGCGLALGIDMVGMLSASTAYGAPYYLHGAWWLLALVKALIIALALLYRRRFPLAGLIVVTLLLLWEYSAQALPNSVALLFMIYAVPVYRSVAAGWVGYGVAVAGSILSYFLTGGAGEVSAETAVPGGVFLADGNGFRATEFIALTVMTAIWYLAILMLGINLGNRRRYVQAIIDRAHQLARERDQLAQLAVAEERSRIAREMHDIVAHSLSVMIALSEGAVRAAQAAPDAAADAMSRSAETGRTALAEMRRLLGALTDQGEQAELVPQPGVQDLPELVRGFRDAGVDARLEISGEASGDRGQDLAVYRVVQEGLTNVLRYAGTGAQAEVRVERLPDRTVVEVRDFGAVPGSSTPVSGVGSGRGIAGLRERARVFGGEISAGPTHMVGGGWLLRAVLPVSAAARERVAGTWNEEEKR